MNKLSLSLLLLLIGALTLGALVWNQRNALAAENQQLHTRVGSLEQELAHAHKTAAAAASSLDHEAQATKLELMRLRNEVSQLRTGSQAASSLEAELNRLRAENQQLRAAQANSNTAVGHAQAQRERLSSEQWQYAGLATPDAALTSALWELQNGQLPTASALVADPAQFAAWKQQLAGAKSVQILERHEISPDERQFKTLPGRIRPGETAQIHPGCFRLALVRISAALQPHGLLHAESRTDETLFPTLGS